MNDKEHTMSRREFITAAMVTPFAENLKGLDRISREQSVTLTLEQSIDFFKNPNRYLDRASETLTVILPPGEIKITDCVNTQMPCTYPSEDGTIFTPEVKAASVLEVPNNKTLKIQGSEGTHIIFPKESSVGFHLSGAGNVIIDKLEISGGGAYLYPDLPREQRPLSSYIAVENGLLSLKNCLIHTSGLFEETDKNDAAGKSGVITVSKKALVDIKSTSIGTEENPMRWDSLFAHLGGTVRGDSVKIFQDRGCTAGCTGTGSVMELSNSSVEGAWKGFGVFGPDSFARLKNVRIASKMWGLFVGHADSALVVSNCIVEGQHTPLFGEGNIIATNSTFIPDFEGNYLMHNPDFKAEGYNLEGMDILHGTGNHMNLPTDNMPTATSPGNSNAIEFLIKNNIAQIHYMTKK